MNTFYIELQNRIKYLEEQLKVLKVSRNTEIQGRLRVSHSRNRTQYYHVTEQDKPGGRYIRKNEIGIAGCLAEKEYIEELMVKIEKELDILRNCDIAYEASNLEAVYGNMNEYRKNLVKNRYLSDEEFAAAWLSAEFVHNDFLEEQKQYPTKNGEPVRSKSEAIIADMYYDMGIPYRYESAVTLMDGRKKFPDFTVLDVKRRKEIYHEHLGLLTNQGYLEGNLEKIEAYNKNGIILGKNLIISYELPNHALNINNVRKTLLEILK